MTNRATERYVYHSNFFFEGRHGSTQCKMKVLCVTDRSVFAREETRDLMHTLSGLESKAETAMILAERVCDHAQNAMTALKKSPFASNVHFLRAVEDAARRAEVVYNASIAAWNSSKHAAKIGSELHHCANDSSTWSTAVVAPNKDDMDEDDEDEDGDMDVVLCSNDVGLTINRSSNPSPVTESGDAAKNSPGIESSSPSSSSSWLQWTHLFESTRFNNAQFPDRATKKQEQKQKQEQEEEHEQKEEVSFDKWLRNAVYVGTDMGNRKSARGSMKRSYDELQNIPQSRHQPEVFLYTTYYSISEEQHVCSAPRIDSFASYREALEKGRRLSFFFYDPEFYKVDDNDEDKEDMKMYGKFKNLCVCFNCQFAGLAKTPPNHHFKKNTRRL